MHTGKIQFNKNNDLLWLNLIIFFSRVFRHIRGCSRCSVFLFLSTSSSGLPFSFLWTITDHGFTASERVSAYKTQAQYPRRESNVNRFDWFQSWFANGTLSPTRRNSPKQLAKTLFNETHVINRNLEARLHGFDNQNVWHFVKPALRYTEKFLNWTDLKLAYYTSERAADRINQFFA